MLGNYRYYAVWNDGEDEEFLGEYSLSSGYDVFSAWVEKHNKPDAKCVVEDIPTKRRFIIRNFDDNWSKLFKNL